MIYLNVYDHTLKIKNTANPMRRIILPLLMLILLAFLSGCCSQSPLNQAIWNNDIEQMKGLIDGGAPIDECSASRENPGCVATPLHSAVAEGNAEAVELLIESGADVNLTRYCLVIIEDIRYPFRGSVLMVSSLKGDVEIAEILLKAGADIKQRTESHLWTLDSLDGYDSLEYSAAMGNFDMAKLLIKYGADINTKAEDGNKAVYTALMKGHIDYVINFVENGLVIEIDPEWMHYNAEIAHLAADHYAPLDEDQAIQFYKKAIELYPQGAKNYEALAFDKKLKELGVMMLAAFGSAFNQYAGSQGVNTSGSFVGANSYIYTTYSYNPNWTEQEYFLEKAKQCGKARTLCQEIVTCYEENQPNVALADCVKQAYQSEEKTVSIQ